MIRFLSRYGVLIALLFFAARVRAQAPSVAQGGVLNGASFSKNSSGLGSPVAPGSLVAIFGSFSGATLATADTVPYSASLGGVSVTFNGVSAPLELVSPAGAFPFVTAEVPFEALPAGQTTATVNVVVSVNNVPSAPEQTTIVAAAPGVFTIPPDGQSNGIFVFVDPTDNIAKIAAPASASATIGYPTAPVPRGTTGFFYATGLGAMTPPVSDGDGGASPPVAHQANATPTVLVGGITAQVLFAGQAPGYPGVAQINIAIPQNAPTGAVSLQIQTADGSITSTSAVTIAIQ
jgi:uncharacterized protein (TIGR03437 family)